MLLKWHVHICLCAHTHTHTHTQIIFCCHVLVKEAQHFGSWLYPWGYRLTPSNGPSRGGLVLYLMMKQGQLPKRLSLMKMMENVQYMSV
jgi:hypothetical protein